MGFSSQNLQDTGRSICNKHSDWKTFNVYMHSPKEYKGKTMWTESDYEGYEVYGGMDFFELFAFINNIEGKDDDDLRSKGIDLFFKQTKGLSYPVLSEDKNWKCDFTKPCKSAEDQGYFYPSADEDDGLEMIKKGYVPVKLVNTAGFYEIYTLKLKKIVGKNVKGKGDTSKYKSGKIVLTSKQLKDTDFLKNIEWEEN